MATIAYCLMIAKQHMLHTESADGADGSTDKHLPGKCRCSCVRQDLLCSAPYCPCSRPCTPRTRSGFPHQHLHRGGACFSGLVLVFLKLNYRSEEVTPRT